ncbi:MAG: hypothetical protein KGN02_09810 [bacterium]|nr:hypothetical protein [bacterium]
MHRSLAVFAMIALLGASRSDAGHAIDQALLLQTASVASRTATIDGEMANAMSHALADAEKIRDWPVQAEVLGLYRVAVSRVGDEILVSFLPGAKVARFTPECRVIRYCFTLRYEFDRTGTKIIKRYFEPH